MSKKLEKMLKEVESSVESTHFIPISKLPISDEAKNSISDSNDITFGDANRSLFSITRIASVIDADDYDTNEKDQATIEAIMQKYGEEFYVDLEN